MIVGELGELHYRDAGEAVEGLKRGGEKKDKKKGADM